MANSSKNIIVGAGVLYIGADTDEKALTDIPKSPATWTASGGSIGPFQYAILYDSTTDNLIGYWDYGSAVTLSTGESFSVVLDGTSGVFTVA